MPEKAAMSPIQDFLVLETLQGLEQGICILDEQLKIVFWNQWLASKTGTTLESIKGTPFTDQVTKKAQAYLHTRLSDSINNGQPDFLSQAFNRYILEIPISQSSNFSFMQQRVRLKPIIQVGQPRFIVVIIEDVTLETDRIKDLNRNRKSLEAIISQRTAKLRAAKEDLEAKVEQRTLDLKTAKETAERATLAKTEFLSNISHEIRTPMNAILGMTHLVLESPLEPSVREELEIVLSAANNMLDLINDVLDFSKIESGKMEINTHSMNLAQEIDGVLGLFEGKFKEKGIHLSKEIALKVPQMIQSDALRVRQILVNLIGNALKFTHQGSVRLSVDFLSETTKFIMLQFSVTDTGIGIPKDKQQTIFSDFSQADASITRRYGGTGLGLSITQTLVGLLGGEIWVQSHEGKGSRFSFTLRCTQARVSIEAAPDIPKQTSVDLSSMQILMVEDNPVNQKLALRMLENAQAKVVVANNGQEAIDILQNQCFDVILMDIQMPVLDGLQTTRLIRSGALKNQVSETPIIAMTANAFDSDRKACFDAGMNDFIAKPFNKSALYESLSQYLP